MSRRTKPAARPAQTLKPHPDQESMMSRIAEALRALRFGRIEIMVQDGQIVLVEKHERQRIHRG
jgi:hypothetical protein